MEAAARWIVRHPLVCLVGHIFLTALLGYFALQIRIEGSVETVLPAGDPEVEYYARTRSTFGSDDVGVIGVLADDVFAPGTITKIARITDAVARLEGVERVLSLTNAVDPAEDVMKPPRLLRHMPATPDEIALVKNRLSTVELYGKSLVAPDFSGAAINVFFDDLSDAEYADLRLDGKISEILARERGPERFLYTGAGHLKQAAVGHMRSDLFRLTPLALALILLVLWLSFRTVRGVVLPLLSVLLAVVWTVGIMVLAGKSLTLGTFVLPPLLLVVGSSYAIHVTARYYENLQAGCRGEKLIVDSLRQIWLPLLVSAATTGIGFGALAVNRITAIRDLGIFSVVGIAFLTVAALTFLPACLALLGDPRAPSRSVALSMALKPLLLRCGQAASRHRRAILAGALVATVLGLAGTRHVRTDSDFLSYFAPGSPVRQANEIINRRIVGSNPFYLVVESNGHGLLRHWDVLRKIKGLQQFLQELPGVTTSISLVDYLELFETGLNQEREGDFEVDEQGNLVPVKARSPFWEDPSSLAPLLKLVDDNPAAFKSVVTADFARANILVRTTLSGSRRIEKTLARLRGYVKRHFPDEIHVHPTGNLVLLTGTTSDIVAGQVRSLALALAVIFMAMAGMFLSVRVGLLTMVPNVLPVLLFFGVLGWSGIALNLGTSLIATIALGIAVDSTIHYMTRLNRELKGEKNQSAALGRTLSAVGVPITLTTAALVLGFLAFSLSSFVPTQNFGLLAALTMLAAFAGDVILLPALMATTKIVTVWDLLGLSLGADPTRTIPLFAGLRPAQARIVALMGELKRFAPGETIVRQGEIGREMYVIVRGTTEVWVGSDPRRERIRTLTRGQEFGEMGLVRRDRRSADVVAVDAVEVLAVDARFLDRIQKRYPRIAARVFLNLTRILSDRVQGLTERLVENGA